MSHGYGSIPMQNRKYKHEFKTYDDASLLFDPEDPAHFVEIGTNVRLIKTRAGGDEWVLQLKFYDTPVVTYHKDGSYTINSGGYHTVATREFIERFTPFKLYAHRNFWYVGLADSWVPEWTQAEFNKLPVFFDGIELDREGNEIVTDVVRSKVDAIVTAVQNKLFEQNKRRLGFTKETKLRAALKGRVKQFLRLETDVLEPYGGNFKMLVDNGVKFVSEVGKAGGGGRLCQNL